MGLLKKIAGWIKAIPKKGLVEDISERLLREKQRSGSVSNSSYNTAAKQLTNALFDGGLGLSKSEEAQQYSLEAADQNLAGTNTRSNNGEFTVIYSEGDDDVKGKVCLLKENKILFRRTVKRPNCCVVSNNGIVICADWVSWESASTGRIIIFDAVGNELFNKKLKSNVGDCGISEDGAFAAFETFYSKKGDSDKYYVIDIKSKEIIKRAKKQIDFPNYFFSVDKRTLTIKSKNFQQVIDF